MMGLCGYSKADQGSAQDFEISDRLAELLNRVWAAGRNWGDERAQPEGQALRMAVKEALLDVEAMGGLGNDGQQAYGAMMGEHRASIAPMGRNSELGVEIDGCLVYLMRVNRIALVAEANNASMLEVREFLSADTMGRADELSEARQNYARLRGAAAQAEQARAQGRAMAPDYDVAQTETEINRVLGIFDNVFIRDMIAAGRRATRMRSEQGTLIILWDNGVETTASGEVRGVPRPGAMLTEPPLAPSQATRRVRLEAVDITQLGGSGRSAMVSPIQDSEEA